MEEHRAASVVKNKVIGIKVNGLGGKGISTHAVLVLAICRAAATGRREPGNIVVWDRNARDLEACGLTINTDPSRVRCYRQRYRRLRGRSVILGHGEHSRSSKILTRECAMVINVPILKDHAWRA